MSTQAAAAPTTEPAWPVFTAQLVSRQEVAAGTMDLIDPEDGCRGQHAGILGRQRPFEDTIMIASRMHHNAARPAVVLSGGIGITPFRSILLQAAKDHLPPGMVRSMQAVLKATGVDSDDIRVEEFTGY